MLADGKLKAGTLTQHNGVCRRCVLGCVRVPVLNMNSDLLKQHINVIGQQGVCFY